MCCICYSFLKHFISKCVNIVTPKLELAEENAKTSQENFDDVLTKVSDLEKVWQEVKTLQAIVNLHRPRYRCSFVLPLKYYEVINKLDFLRSTLVVSTRSMQPSHSNNTLSSIQLMDIFLQLWCGPPPPPSPQSPRSCPSSIYLLRLHKEEYLIFSV